MTLSNKNIAKKGSKTSKRKAIRVTPRIAIMLQEKLAEINKKPHGRKIKVSELLERLIPLLTTSIIDELRDNSLSSKDRLEIEYRAYIKTNGATSKDEFIGHLLNKFNNNTAHHQRPKTHDQSGI